MRTIIKLSIMLLLSVFSTLTLAGSVYNAKRPCQPMVRDMSGFYIGLGAGPSSIIAHESSFYTQNVTGTAPDTFYYPVSLMTTANNMFPAVQIGYWGHARPNILWGVKAFYKYLDSNSDYTVTGAFTGSVRVAHEVALVLDVGMILWKLTPYAGVGAIWLPSVKDIYRGGVASTSTYADLDEGKSRIGAMAQLGVLYNLSSVWFLDCAYSFGFTGRSTYSGSSNAPTDSFVTRKNRVTLQEIMVSINRRF